MRASSRPPTCARCSASYAGSSPATDPNLLVGFDTADDAAVYRLRDDLAIVVTTDFFTPIVDDPFDWGRIAATNALSDVYAMGGTPLLALNLVGWPREGLPFELLARVLDGGAAVAARPGCLIAGGHSIDDAEPKYGLAVVGTVDPDARAHQRGCARRRRPRADQADRARSDLDRGEAGRRDARSSLDGDRRDDDAQRRGPRRRGSRRRARGDRRHRVRSARTSARAVRGSGVGARSSTPVRCRSSTACATSSRPGMVAGGTAAQPRVRGARTSTSATCANPSSCLLADAQTSGGLLLSVPAERGRRLFAACRERGTLAAAVGAIVAGPTTRSRITVR